MKNNRINQNQSLQKEVQYIILDSVTAKLLLRRVIQHIKKNIIALNNLFHKTTFGVFSKTKFPYAQIAFIGLVIFVMTKKDLHFQVSMNAPLAKMMTPAEKNESKKEVEQLGMVQPIHFVETKKKKKVEKSIPYTLDFQAEEVEAYIKRFGKIAITEQQKYGIPASIKLAQGLLESKAGQSEATQKTNNHFGQPMANENYDSAWLNWRYHSHYLTDAASPFQPLLQFDLDYKKWAVGLKDLGYSSWNNYDKALIEIIEKYEMYRLDRMAK